VRKSEPLEQLSLSRVSENGTSIAVISGRAGAILELSLNDVVIMPKTVLPNARDFSYGTVLAPWPNRLEDGKYVHRGIEYQFGDLDALHNKNHGLLGKEDLEVRFHSDTELRLGHLFGSDPGYPFQVDLEISYQLLESSLLVTAIATNHGPQAPFAIGFHPYLLTGETFSLSAPFTQTVLTNERMLPWSTKAMNCLEINQDSKQLPTLDACFSGAAAVKVLRPIGNFEVRVLENLPYFMLYRPPRRFFEQGESLAIEPMSAAANAFRNDPDLVQLAAGEVKRFSFDFRTL
jgi:aldose 1-epimerase